MEQITKSMNIFVDTALGDYNSEDSNGMNYMLNFNTLSIDCPSDGFFRLSLVDFCMLKSFTNINTHNSKFILRMEKTGAFSDFELEIPHKNYATIYDLAVAFFNVVGNKIIEYVNGQVANTLDAVVLSNLTPDSSAGISGTSDNVLSAILTFNKSGSPVNLTSFITSAKIQTYLKLPANTSESYSTAYQILGSLLIRDNTDRTTSSMTPVLALSSGQIIFTGFYPALRFNEPYVYLRCSLPSSNLATSGLDYYTKQSGENSDLHHSNLLARFPVDSEIINYNANHNYEYFIDLHQHHLTNIRFYLTMNHGETIPEFNNSQNTLGNQAFSMTLRLDIIRKITSNENKLCNNNPNCKQELFFPRDYSNVKTFTNSNQRLK